MCIYPERWHEEDGSRHKIGVDELTDLTFDFTFRMSPSVRASVNFRFNSDFRVSGHPNEMTYIWKLLSDGRQVALGDFPVAEVYRRSDWGWVVANCNIVCCSLDDQQKSASASASAKKDSRPNTLDEASERLEDIPASHAHPEYFDEPDSGQPVSFIMKLEPF